MTGLQFVSDSTQAQNDQDRRKLIRRHVMLGKNLGRTPKRPKQSFLAGTAVFRVDESIYQLARPRGPLGSGLTFLHFADTVSDQLKQDTVRFCTTTTETMYVLEPCIAFDSRDDWAVCLQPLCCDALYANAMIFGSQVYVENAFRQATSQCRNLEQDLKHYDKSLRLLRERLPGISSQQSMAFDAVILAVYTLAMHALISGDLAVARSHIVGLSSLADMKPTGIHSFRGRTKQMIELLRCDLSIALAIGQPPLFSPTSPHEPVVLFSNPSAAPMARLSTTWLANDELIQIWQVLSQFCTSINEAAVSSRQVSQDLLLETMASATYRALSLSLPSDAVYELVRLTILAFCVLIFLDWPLLRIPFPWLQNRMDAAIAEMMQHNPRDVDASLVLWILVIRLVAFQSVPLSRSTQLRMWLLEATERCGVLDWASAKNIMTSFLWIDVVCDRRAQLLFEELFRMQMAGNRALGNVEQLNLVDLTLADWSCSAAA